MIPLKLALGFGIGLSLGLLDGGGSLLGQKGFITVYNVSGETGAWQYSGLEPEYQ